MLMTIMIIIALVIIAYRSQKVPECEVGHLSALGPRNFVRGAEVDAFVNTAIDHFLCRIREAVKCARVLDGRPQVGGRHREGHSVCPEEERKGTGCGTGKIVCARAVVGIGRTDDQRLPGWVADSPRVAVVVPLLNGGDWPPEDVEFLSIPRRD